MLGQDGQDEPGAGGDGRRGSAGSWFGGHGRPPASWMRPARGAAGSNKNSTGGGASEASRAGVQGGGLPIRQLPIDSMIGVRDIVHKPTLQDSPHPHFHTTAPRRQLIAIPWVPGRGGSTPPRSRPELFSLRRNGRYCLGGSWRGDGSHGTTRTRQRQEALLAGACPARIRVAVGRVGCAFLRLDLPRLREPAAGKVGGRSRWAADRCYSIVMK